MTWIVSDPVEIRSQNSQTWTAGTVTAVSDTCYRVTLTVPITADAWLGITRLRNGDAMVSTVDVFKHCSTIVPDVHIRTPV